MLCTDGLYHVLFFWVIATLASDMPAATGRKCIKNYWAIALCPYEN